MLIIFRCSKIYQMAIRKQPKLAEIIDQYDYVSGWLIKYLFSRIFFFKIFVLQTCEHEAPLWPIRGSEQAYLSADRLLQSWQDGFAATQYDIIYPSFFEEYF